MPHMPWYASKYSAEMLAAVGRFRLGFCCCAAACITRWRSLTVLWRVAIVASWLAVVFCWRFLACYPLAHTGGLDLVGTSKLASS